nr:hypothetical protein [Tanacetum cinerariifolium]
MALDLMSKAFQLNNTTTINNNQRSSSKPCYSRLLNRHRNGNVVAARAEGNSNEINGNQIRCYNCRGEGDYDEIDKVNANCNLQDNLQQASTSGTQSDKALVYDSNGSVEVFETQEAEFMYLFASCLLSTSRDGLCTLQCIIRASNKRGVWKVYSVICSTNNSNGENQVVSKSSAVTTADASDKHQQQQQDSTSST